MFLDFATSADMVPEPKYAIYTQDTWHETLKLAERSPFFTKIARGDVHQLIPTTTPPSPSEQPIQCMLHPKAQTVPSWFGSATDSIKALGVLHICTVFDIEPLAYAELIASTKRNPSPSTSLLHSLADIVGTLPSLTEISWVPHLTEISESSDRDDGRRYLEKTLADIEKEIREDFGISVGVYRVLEDELRDGKRVVARLGLDARFGGNASSEP